MEIGKRVREIVRVILFMIKKGVSKSKLLFDLSLLLKRGNKIATKAIHNLMFHHHHHHHPNSRLYDQSFVAQPREYEFSCSNTPQYYQYLPWNGSSKRRHGHGHHNAAANFFRCAFHEPKTQDDDVTANAVKLALEMLNNRGGGDVAATAVEASPYLPGFGRSPAVRQLRITDSPFPLKDAEEDDNGYVDMKAEEFIQKFYKELNKQING